MGVGDEKEWERPLGIRQQRGSSAAIPPHAGRGNWHFEAESGEDVIPAGVGEEGGREDGSGVLFQRGGDRAEGADDAWEGEAISHGGDENPIVFREGDVRGCVGQEVDRIVQRSGSFEAM